MLLWNGSNVTKAIARGGTFVLHSPFPDERWVVRRGKEGFFSLSGETWDGSITCEETTLQGALFMLLFAARSFAWFECEKPDTPSVQLLLPRLFEHGMLSAANIEHFLQTGTLSFAEPGVLWRMRQVDTLFQLVIFRQGEKIETHHAYTLVELLIQAFFSRAIYIPSSKKPRASVAIKGFVR